MKANTRRKEHQRLRWRLLYGTAEDDIRARLVRAVGAERTAAWGPLDLTANPFLSVWTQAAASYRSEPKVYAPDGAQVAADAVAACGHWQLMQRTQRDTLALREMIVRIEVDPVSGEILTIPVPPYLVDVEVDPRSPYRALAVTEERPDPDDHTQTVRVVCDPRSRTYMALDSHDRDVSERVFGGSMSGDAYPYTAPDGTAVLPYVCYRAALTGSYWDPYTGRELVETSLQLSVLYSFYMHCAKDASWPQRYAVDARPVGAPQDADSGRGIVTDPATLLLLRNASDDGTSAQIGQWGAASDPESVLRSIQAYERRAVDAALGTANVSRANSDVRSGFSLAVSRDDQRELQRSYEPVFRAADLELLGKVATLLGEPSEGWRIEYQAIPQSPAEQRAEVGTLVAKMDAGLISKTDAYMQMHPQLTREQAEAALAESSEQGGSVLNGAQVTSLVEVLRAVRAGEIPQAGAVNVIRASFGVDESAAASFFAGIERLAPLPSEEQ